MEQAEMQAILSHVFNRLQRLEADMSVLQTKEKDLRTIMADGFAKADDFHIWVRSKFEESGNKFAKIDQKFTQIDQKFIDLEDQIDTLATQSNIRFDILEKRMDKMDARIDKIDNKTDILDQRTKDTNLKIDKILTYLAIA